MTDYIDDYFAESPFGYRLTIALTIQIIASPRFGSLTTRNETRDNGVTNDGRGGRSDNRKLKHILTADCYTTIVLGRPQPENRLSDSHREMPDLDLLERPDRLGLFANGEMFHQTRGGENTSPQIYRRRCFT